MTNQLKINDPSELKKLTHSEEYGDMITNIFKYKALATLLERFIETYRSPLRDSYDFVMIRRGKTSPVKTEKDLDYSDEELRINEYFLKVDRLHRKAGFNVTDTTCPVSIMKDMQSQAEDKLLNYMEENLGMPKWILWEDRQRMLDLYINMGVKSFDDRGIDLREKIMAEHSDGGNLVATFNSLYSKYK